MNFVDDLDFFSYSMYELDGEFYFIAHASFMMSTINEDQFNTIILHSGISDESIKNIFMNVDRLKRSYLREKKLDNIISN